MLFAGDYMSAVFHLTRGLRDFEFLPQFEIDLGDFAPDPNLLDVRRADLERKLERKLSQKNRYRLRFLLGYAEYYSGLKEFGLPRLREAAEEARRACSAGRMEGSERLTAEIIMDLPERLTRTEPATTPEP
jgi:hypothetical protein